MAKARESEGLKRLEALIAIQTAQVDRLKRAVEETGGADIKQEDALTRAVGRLESLLLDAYRLRAEQSPAARPSISILYDYGDEQDPQRL